MPTAVGWCLVSSELILKVSGKEIFQHWAAPEPTGVLSCRVEITGMNKSIAQGR